MSNDFNAGVQAVAREIAKRRALLNSQFEALDIGREDAVYAICAEIAADLLRPEPAPRPMTGILATLTDEQRAAVLAYDGDETLGDPNDPALSTTTENYGGSDSSHAPGPVAFDERKLHDLWTMGNCRMPFARFRDAVLAAAHPAPTCTAQTGPAPEPVAEIVRGVWGRCEALEDEAYEKLLLSTLSVHERGFWGGQKMAAKSIRRSTEMPPLPAPACAAPAGTPMVACPNRDPLLRTAVDQERG